MSDTESVTTQNEFKDVVKEWLQIFDTQAELRKKVSSLNKRKKQLSDIIITFMKSNEKEICNLGNSGIIEVRTQRTPVSLKKDYVEKLLGDFFKNSNTAKETTEFIFENREIKEKSVLKRSAKVIE